MSFFTLNYLTSCAFCHLFSHSTIDSHSEGKRGRKPVEIEQMLRMSMLQVWFSLSDEGVEDAIYDSYAMKSFMGIDFSAGEQTPDATTLCKFRKLLNEHGLQKKFFE